MPDPAHLPLILGLAATGLTFALMLTLARAIERSDDRANRSSYPPRTPADLATQKRLELAASLALSVTITACLMFTFNEALKLTSP